MTLPKTPSFRLDGKLALVTGGSRGIGQAAACALGEAGSDVTIAARSEAELAQAVTDMQAAGMTAQGHTLDVTETDAVRAFFAAHGPFDILVNSAGLARHGPALDTDPDDFDAVMAVNVKAAYFLAQEAARGMARGGSIIQISSQMGHVGGVDRAVYCGSKFALEGMTKAMAIEWGPRGIRVNTVCPTFIRTPLTEPTFNDPDKLAWVRSNIKLDRVGAVEDIMGPVLFLASEASALVTGTALLVDGGWTAS